MKNNETAPKPVVAGVLNAAASPVAVLIESVKPAGMFGDVKLFKSE